MHLHIYLWRFGCFWCERALETGRPKRRAVRPPPQADLSFCLPIQLPEDPQGDSCQCVFLRHSSFVRMYIPKAVYNQWWRVPKCCAHASPSPPLSTPSLQGGTIWRLDAFQRSGALTCSACTGDQNPVSLQLSGSQLKSHLGFFLLQHSEGCPLLCGCNSFQRSKGEISYWNRYVTCIVNITHTTFPWAGVLSCLKVMLIK